MQAFWAQRRVWIIGASSGIGRALAVTLDKAGAQLVLSARREDALQELNAELGSRHQLLPLDVTNDAQLETACHSILPNCDSVIFMAGTYEPMPLDKQQPEAVRQIIATNLTAAVQFVGFSYPLLKAARRGQLALCASVAGYCGLPNAQPYGATKAGLINLAESLRIEAAGTNVDIRLINPGFVTTPMTSKNPFTMPMIIPAQQAAEAIARGLAGSAFEIHFPRRFTYVVKLLGHLPYWLYFRLVRS